MWKLFLSIWKWGCSVVRSQSWGQSSDLQNGNSIVAFECVELQWPPKPASHHARTFHGNPPIMVPNSFQRSDAMYFTSMVPWKGSTFWFVKYACSCYHCLDFPSILDVKVLCFRFLPKSWNLLTKLGDQGLASVIGPCALVVWYCWFSPTASEAGSFQARVIVCLTTFLSTEQKSYECGTIIVLLSMSWSMNMIIIVPGSLQKHALKECSIADIAWVGGQGKVW